MIIYQLYENWLCYKELFLMDMFNGLDQQDDFTWPLWLNAFFFWELASSTTQQHLLINRNSTNKQIMWSLIFHFLKSQWSKKSQAHAHEQSCWTLCSPLDCSPPGSSVHGILQARILEWVAISSSRGSSRPGDRIHVSCVFCCAGGFFTHWAIKEATVSRHRC